LKAFAILFGIGAVMLTVFDMFHTHSGTTAYTHEVFMKAAWWAPLLFGTSLSVGGLVYVRGYRAMRGPSELPNNAALAAALVIYAGLWCASGYAPFSNEGKLAFLLVGFAAMWWMLDRSWQGVAMAAVTAVGGCTTEYVLVRANTFRHLQPDFLGLPVWLPGIYLVSGAVLGQLSRKVFGSGNKVHAS
jgi:hypothetical protein